jgi:two-component system OmpR family sensor kinase
VRRPLDLRSLAETVVDDLSDRGEAVRSRRRDRGARRQSRRDQGDAQQSRDNAVKYAGGAEVTLSRVDGHAVIEVRDERTGHPPEDLDASSSRSSAASARAIATPAGSVSACASARAVARAHGGDVVLADRRAAD